MPRKAGTNGTKKGSANGITDADGYLCLRGEDLWKFRAVDAEYNKLQAQLSEVRQQIKTQLEAHPELKAVFDKQLSLVGELKKAETNLREVHKYIEKKFGVDLTKCGIDDDTGRLQQVVNDKMTPLKPTTKKSKRTAGAAS